MVKAIAVDMDGTFLDSKKNYDKDRFEKIFKALKERNIEFIAASGNQFAKLQSIFEKGICSLFLKMVQLFTEVKIYIIIVASIKLSIKKL